MRHYNVNRISHSVYDDASELPGDIHPILDWKESVEGDWVKADDDCYIQILKKGILKKNKGKNKQVHYFRTCTGTYTETGTMDTSRRENIYTISGLNSKTDIRERLNKYELLFVEYVAAGMKPVDAYLKSFPTNNPNYANIRSSELIKCTRIRKAMKKELEPVLEKLGITEETVLEGIKAVADDSEKDDTRLKALFKLSDILDLEDKSSANITQLTGIQFQGFSDQQIEDAERPKELNAL
jgi:hypothetical protein